MVDRHPTVAGFIAHICPHLGLGHLIPARFLTTYFKITPAIGVPPTVVNRHQQFRLQRVPGIIRGDGFSDCPHDA